MTSAIGVDQILSQIRALRQQPLNTADIAVPGAAAGSPTGVAKADFGDMLKQSVAAVNDLDNKASTLAAGFERGDNVSLASVMVSMQKADVSFKAVAQVRNKFIDAYNTVMQMSV